MQYQPSSPSRCPTLFGCILWPLLWAAYGTMPHRSLNTFGHPLVLPSNRRGIGTILRSCSRHVWPEWSYRLFSCSLGRTRVDKTKGGFHKMTHNCKKMLSSLVCLLIFSFLALGSIDSGNKTYTPSPSRTPKVDSIPGVSDDQLVAACKVGCESQFRVGTTDYNNCVYCCTHDCKKWTTTIIFRGIKACSRLLRY